MRQLTLTLNSFRIRTKRSAKHQSDTVKASVTVRSFVKRAGDPVKLNDDEDSKSLGDFDDNLEHGIDFSVTIDEPLRDNVYVDVAFKLDNGDGISLTALLNAAAELGLLVGGISKNPFIIGGAILASFATLVFPNCDGTVATIFMRIDQKAFNNLYTAGPQTKTEEFPGLESPAGCGENSFYYVTWSISPVGVQSGGLALGKPLALRRLILPIRYGKDKMMLLMADRFGAIKSASWEAGDKGFGAWRPIASGKTAPYNAVFGLSRVEGAIDAFVVGTDGAIYASALNADGETWRDWVRLGDMKVPLNAPVSAVARHQKSMDLFVVGEDGQVYTAMWMALDKKWRPWKPISGLTSIPGTFVAGSSCAANKLDIAVVDASKSIQTSSWQQGDTAWKNWRPMAGGQAPLGAPVTLVSRDKEKLDAFVTGTDGRIYTAAIEKGDTNWRGWWPVGTLKTEPGNYVGAVSRAADKLDIFVSHGDGLVSTAAWESGDVAWRGWWPIGDIMTPTGAPVSAVSRSLDKLDIFAMGADAAVYTAAWEPGDLSWRGWWKVEGAWWSGGTK